MLHDLLPMVPHDATKIVLVLALALFVGFEREEHKQHDTTYSFGGVRTFPLLGLVSYALALLSIGSLTPWVIGFAVIGVFMLLSYQRKLASESPAGLTTEISGLVIYVVGGLVQREHYWIGTTIAVISVLLLELKKGLEGLTKHIASREITTAAKFLVLAVVILPIVPDRDFTQFHLNPFKSWLVVVAVSGVSFASYVVQRLMKGRGGVVLSAILGGAYSSTVTTVVLARRGRTERRPNLFAGSILTACGVMYARLVLLLALFNRPLALKLAPGFLALGLLGGSVGWLISRRSDDVVPAPPEKSVEVAQNPLELRASFLFALIFVVVLVVTGLARQYFGQTGLYSLAAIMGITDVNPFILGLAQGLTATPLRVAAIAIILAAASNNVIKAIYSYAFGDRATGRRSGAMLLAFAVLGLVPLVWV